MIKKNFNYYNNYLTINKIVPLLKILIGISF